MSYEINVTRDGKHYFATHERSITDREHAGHVFRALRQAFPASDGYAITVTWSASVGHDVTEEIANA